MLSSEMAGDVAFINGDDYRRYHPHCRQLYQKFGADSVGMLSPFMDLRLEKIAQELRNTNRGFAEIIEDVGLDPEQKNYIYTCFKKCYGVTVKNYRLQATSGSP